MHPWIVIALLGGALGAAASSTNKFIFVRISKYASVQIASAGIVGIVIAGTLSLFQDFHALPTGKALLGIVSGFGFGIAITTVILAIRKGQVSQVTPLRFLSTVFVALIALIFLHETLQLRAYLGIACILLGAALIDGGKMRKAFQLNSILGYMIVSGLAYAITVTIVKYLNRYSDVYTVLFYTRLGLFMYTLPFLFLNYRLIWQAIKPRPLKNSALLALAGAFGTTSLLLVIFASASGQITIVSALAATSPFFALLYVNILHRHLPDVYRDKTGPGVLPRRLLISSLMFIGVVLTL